MAEGGKPPSLLDIMREQGREDEASDRYNYQPQRRRSLQPTRTRTTRYPPQELSHDLITRGPFEESFDAAQDLQTVITTRNRKPCRITRDELRKLAQQCICDISQAGNHVSIQLVEAKMCRTIGVRDLIEVGCRNAETDIPELQELKRLHAKVSPDSVLHLINGAGTLNKGYNVISKLSIYITV